MLDLGLLIEGGTMKFDIPAEALPAAVKAAMESVLRMQVGATTTVLRTIVANAAPLLLTRDEAWWARRLRAHLMIERKLDVDIEQAARLGVAVIHDYAERHPVERCKPRELATSLAWAMWWDRSIVFERLRLAETDAVTARLLAVWVLDWGSTCRRCPEFWERVHAIATVLDRTKRQLTPSAVATRQHARLRRRLQVRVAGVFEPFLASVVTGPSIAASAARRPSRSNPRNATVRCGRTSDSS